MCKAALHHLAHSKEEEQSHFQPWAVFPGYPLGVIVFVGHPLCKLRSKWHLVVMILSVLTDIWFLLPTEEINDPSGLLLNACIIRGSIPRPPSCFPSFWLSPNPKVRGSSLITLQKSGKANACANVKAKVVTVMWAGVLFGSIASWGIVWSLCRTGTHREHPAGSHSMACYGETRSQAKEICT